jgi:hypothetical protein
MITKVSCGRSGQIVYHFDNGNEVSILWAWGSYSDNHINALTPNYRERMLADDWESTTVEVYSMGKDTNGFTKYLEKTYGDNPAAFVSVADIPAILKRADKKL